MYFVKDDSLLWRFDEVDIKNVPRIENQEDNDLTHIASSYRVSMEKLEGLIEIKQKLILIISFPFELSKSKLVGVEGTRELKNFIEIFEIDNLANND